MLSLICEATSSNLCRYEQGIHMPRIRTLQSISRALNVPLDELLGPLKINGEVAGEGSTSEPVGYVSGSYGGYCVIQPTDPALILPVGLALYRAPTEWVGLDDNEIHQAFCYAEYETNLRWNHNPEGWCEAFAAYIEAKLKEKNT